MRGQAIDIKETVASVDDLYRLYYLKTGSLLEAACLLGYYSATDNPSVEVENDIRTYARAIGIAFQIHDDLLDTKADPSVTGKPVGNDMKNGTKTILSFMGSDSAEKLEYDLTVSAIEAITDYADSDGVCQLAVWLMSRKK